MNLFSVLSLVVLIAICSSPSLYGNRYKQPYALKSFVKEIVDLNICRSIVIFHDSSMTTEEAIIDLFELSLPLYNVLLNKLNEFNKQAQPTAAAMSEESRIYFVLIPDLNLFYQSLLATRELYFRRDRDRIVFLVNQDYDNRYNEVKTNFILCFRHLILNVVLIFWKHTVEAYTYNPYTDEYLIPVKDGYVFPDKLRDMMGHRLRISMFENVIDAIPNNGNFLGRDGILSQTVMRHLNSSYIYLKSHDGVDYGINFNGSRFTGVFADIVHNESDIAFNARLLKVREFVGYLDYTYPYERDDLTCLVPRNYNDPVKHIEATLQTEVWIATGCTVILCMVYVVVSTQVFRRQLSSHRIWWIVYSLFLIQPVRDTNIKYSRYFLVLFTVSYFFLITAFECHLTSVLTVPNKPHQMNTLNELAESNYKIVTLIRYKHLLNQSLTRSIRKKLIPKIECILEEEQLKRVTKIKKEAIICKDHLARYALIHKNNFVNGVSYYRIMKERPFPSLVCYAVRYGSPYLRKIDEVIKRLVESGIFKYWRNSATHNLSIAGHVTPDGRSRHKSDLALGLKNISFLFFVIGYGLVIATVLFILEYQYHHSRLERYLGRHAHKRPCSFHKQTN